MSKVFRTMVQVTVVGGNVEGALMGQELQFTVDASIRVTKTHAEDTLENGELLQMVYVADELNIGFVNCGNGVLDGEDKYVYYVIDADNTEYGNKLYVLDEFVDDSLEEDNTMGFNEIKLTTEIEDCDEGHIGEYIAGTVYINLDSSSEGVINGELVGDCGREVSVDGKLFGIWESDTTTRKYVMAEME